MINLEITITLVAMLVAFFIVIYLLQKGRARKKRIKQDFETLDLARQLKCNTRESENLSSLGLKPLNFRTEKDSSIDNECKLVVASGIIIFAAFLGWALFLINKQLIILASISGLFALGCLVLLIVTKSKLLRGKSEIWKIRHAVDEYEKSLSLTLASAVFKPLKSLPSAYKKPLNELYEIAEGYHCVPEDSTLKRHYLSNLIAEIEALHPIRPTDSMLKRHYDSLIVTELQQKLESLSKSASPLAVNPISTTQSPPLADEAMDSDLQIPEDSMLRRHFLTHLRNKIAAGLGPEPTDSMLKRHFDTLVKTKLEQCLAANSIKNQHDSSKFSQNINNEFHQQLPQDSMLKRHFLTQLRGKIEAKFPTAPTDFNLLRHYKTLVKSKLKHELEEHSLN